jgi:hypothetical protein
VESPKPKITHSSAGQYSRDQPSALFHFTLPIFFPNLDTIRLFSIFFRKWANFVAGLRAI